VTHMCLGCMVRFQNVQEFPLTIFLICGAGLRKASQLGVVIRVEAGSAVERSAICSTSTHCDAGEFECILKTLWRSPLMGIASL